MAVPNHVAVIMDGNGRWARARGLPRAEGHRRGIASLRTAVKACRSAGVRHLTVFAFSSENWSRPKAEVQALLQFFLLGLQKEAGPLAEAGVRLHVVGDVSSFPERLRSAVAKAEEATAHADGMTLNVAMNYGGRWDIVQAARRLAEEGRPLTEESLTQALSLPWAGPVDLLIRTGGEQRISNFLLWQSAYAELWFTDVLWPDFAEDSLTEALAWFAGRERRFGRTSEQVRSGLPQDSLS